MSEQDITAPEDAQGQADTDDVEGHSSKARATEAPSNPDGDDDVQGHTSKVR